MFSGIKIGVLLYVSNVEWGSLCGCFPNRADVMVSVRFRGVLGVGIGGGGSTADYIGNNH